MDADHAATPFVISYFTRDIAANCRFYGDFLGLPLRTEPGLEDAFFLAGSENVRLQVLKPPAGLGMGDQPPSSGLVIIGVDGSEDLNAIRERARMAGLEEQADRDERADLERVLRYLDPDSRMVIVQLFDRSRRFHD